MLRNYFKIAMRNLSRHKFYSALNILGLGIGIAAFLFILLYTRHELSYDKYHPDADRVLRIDFDGRLGENEIHSAQNVGPLGPTLLDEYPEVETYCRFRDRGSFLIKHEDNHFKERGAIFVDSTFFDVFGVKLLDGNPQTCLTEPRSVVMSATMVTKYFGNNRNPIGESLILDNGDSYEITGVMQDIPSATHFDYDFLLSMSTIEESRQPNWGSFNFNTYVRLAPGTDETAFLAKTQGTFRRNFEQVLRDYVGTSWDDFMAGGNYAKFALTNLTDIHLRSDRADELAANGDQRYVTIFSLIGFFILIIAGINFVNLATARSVHRAREVGVRKVVGARRANLVRQFLSESTLIAMLSMLLAGALVLTGLNLFNDLTAKSFERADLLRPTFIAVAFGVALITGLLSGVYPALYLSGFRPVKVLKGRLSSHQNKSTLRNALVVLQFFITTLLIIGTVVVTKQLQFMQNKKLGFDREQVLILNDVYALDQGVETFKNRVLQHPDVIYASVSGFLPVESERNFSSYVRGRQASPDNAILMANWRVDFDYIKTMGIEVVRGRDFNIQQRTDSSAVIINEELARQLGYDNPVGEYISELDSGDEITSYEIIGVVGDFHFANLRESILPLVFFIGRSTGAMSMRLQTNNISGFVADLRSLWDEMAPGQPFEYQFMDERFDRMYEAERRLGDIALVFSGLAIFVACMGLLGLATYIAQQRTKEIGIRKVLGASISNLVYLLCRDFGLLILISFLLAAPLGWYLMDHWLMDFAHATTMNIGVLIISGLSIMVIGILSIVYQASRVAVIDPVKTLKWDG